MSDRDEQSPTRVKLPQRSPFADLADSEESDRTLPEDSQTWANPPTGSAYPRPTPARPLSNRGPRPVRRLPTATAESPFESWSDEDPWVDAIQSEDATVSRHAFEENAPLRGGAFLEAATTQRPAHVPTSSRVSPFEATAQRPSVGPTAPSEAILPTRPKSASSLLSAPLPSRPSLPRRAAVSSQDTVMDMTPSTPPEGQSSHHARTLMQHTAVPTPSSGPLSAPSHDAPSVTRAQTASPPESPVVQPRAPSAKPLAQQETLLQHRAIVFPGGQAPFEEPFPAQPEVQRPRSLDLKGSELHPAEQSQPRIIIAPQATHPPIEIAPYVPTAKPFVPSAPAARPLSAHDTELTREAIQPEALPLTRHPASAPNERPSERPQSAMDLHRPFSSSARPEVTLTAIAMPAFQDLPEVKPFQPLRPLGWLSAALLTAAAFLPTHTQPPWELLIKPLETSFLALVALLAVCGLQLWKTKEQTRSYAGAVLSLVLVGLSTLSLQSSLHSGVFQGQPALSALSPGGIGFLSLGIGFWCGSLITFWRSRGPATRLRARLLLGLGLVLCALPAFGVGLADTEMPSAWLKATQESPFLGDRLAATVALGLIPLALISIVIAFGPLAAQARTLAVITWLFGIAPLMVLALFASTSADWLEALAPLKAALFVSATVIYLGGASGSLSLLYRDARATR